MLEALVREQFHKRHTKRPSERSPFERKPAPLDLQSHFQVVLCAVNRRANVEIFGRRDPTPKALTGWGGLIDQQQARRI
jgi:hypothetical protein